MIVNILFNLRTTEVLFKSFFCQFNVVYCLQTKLYTEDWIGLRTLDEAGKVKFVSVSGNHLAISRSDMKKYIVPYLIDNASTQLVTAGSLSHVSWFSSIWNNFLELAGITENRLLLQSMD